MFFRVNIDYWFCRRLTKKEIEEFYLEAIVKCVDKGSGKDRIETWLSFSGLKVHYKILEFIEKMEGSDSINLYSNGVGFCRCNKCEKMILFKVGEDCGRELGLYSYMRLIMTKKYPQYIWKC